MKTTKKIVSLAIVLLFATALVFANGNTEASSEKTTYKVGICQLVQHAALDQATQGFIDALTEEFGDSVTFDNQNASGDAATVTTIINGLVSSNVDLILANATLPLQTAAASTADIPILGTSITHYGVALDMDLTEDGATGINVSGTSDLAPLDRQADMITELFPDVKNVGLLYCSAEPNSVFQIQEVEKYLDAKGVNHTRFSFTDSSDVSAVTAAACQEADVIYIPTDNTAASCTEAIRNVVEPAKVPVIAGEEGICAGCGVATLSISYYDLGYTTGKMAVDILKNGADISTMPVQYAPNVTKKYNAELCQILGVEIPSDYVEI